MGPLKGKRALVTGGGQGLGYAVVQHLLRAGAGVAVHYFSREGGARELKVLGLKLGRRLEALRVDLGHEGEATELARSTAEFLGGLEVLVNNAGDLVQRRRLDEVDLEFWKRVMDVNVTSMMLVTRAAVPYLTQAGGSSIVNLSSLAGRKG